MEGIYLFVLCKLEFKVHSSRASIYLIQFCVIFVCELNWIEISIFWFVLNYLRLIFWTPMSIYRKNSSSVFLMPLRNSSKNVVSFLEHLHNCFGDIAKVEKLYTEPSLFYKPISRQCFISNSPNRLIYTEKYYLRSGKNPSCEDFKFFRLLLKRLLMVQCSNSHEMWELPYWPDSVQMNRNHSTLTSRRR